MPKIDGGPAYPIKDYTNKDIEGLSIRDHFAGLAMQALVSSIEVGSWGMFAQQAYEMADAMLAERAKS